MHEIISRIVLVASLFTIACSGDDDDDDGAGAGAGAGEGEAEAEAEAESEALLLAPELGSGDHGEDSVDFTLIADEDSRLREPRDLAFNPLRDDELWIVNHADDSAVIVFHASTDERTSERRLDGYALHFFDAPSALAFGGAETTIGTDGTFATCGESRNDYNHQAEHNDFMGPALWSSDLSVFAMFNPNGLGSHLDMLHCSPLCMGIAHQEDNVYWAFDGLHEAIVNYDFAQDDGIGNDDHSDGEAYRYVEGEVGYVEGVPSHVFYRAKDAMLYIADTGNARIARLDTTSGEPGARLTAFEPMEEYRRIDDAVIEDVVPASSELLEAPSGLEVRDELIYVSDNANGRISAFTLEGERVNWLDTGLAGGALGGMAFGPDDKLYFADSLGERVLRVDP